MSEDRLDHRWWDSDDLLCFKSSMVVFGILGAIAQWIAVFFGALMVSGAVVFITLLAIGD